MNGTCLLSEFSFLKLFLYSPSHFWFHQICPFHWHLPLWWQGTFFQGEGQRMTISFPSFAIQWMVPLEDLAWHMPWPPRTSCPATLYNASSAVCLYCPSVPVNSDLRGKAQPCPEQRGGQPRVAQAASSLNETNQFPKRISKGRADYACADLESQPLRFNLSSDSFLLTEPPFIFCPFFLFLKPSS